MIAVGVLSLFNQRAYSWRVFAEGALQVALLKVFCFKWSVKKHCIGKVFTRNLEESFFYKNNRNYNSYKFSYKFTFIPFLTFHRNQKQESNFQRVVGLVTRNSFVFCL